MNLATDRIVQAAGPFNELLGCQGDILDHTLVEVVGVSASALIDSKSRQGAALRLKPAGDELVATAHAQSSLVVVEFECASPPRSSEAILGVIAGVGSALSAADNMQAACQVAAEAVREISGYDRVMAYSFQPDWSGTVVGEARNDIYPTLLNHRFPESDIPKQARELYARNPIRVIPDASYSPAVLRPDAGPPLDMSGCFLRSVSPVHLQYLKNMGVGASMSVSIIMEGVLWGLLAAHSRIACHLSFEDRELCSLVGRMLAERISILNERRKLRSVQDLAVRQEEALFELRGARDPTARLTGMLSTLRALVDSSGVAIVAQSEVRKEGLVPPEVEISALAEWLETNADETRGFSTDRLSELIPAAAVFSHEASGVLSVLIRGEQPMWLMWFRAEQVVEVEWAGNPHGKSPEIDGVLTPRGSFDVWRETVRNRSRAWSSAEVDAAQLFATRASAILQSQAIRKLNGVLRKLNEQLSVEATTDPLTGLANRRALNRYVREQWELAQAYQHPISLLMVDVDFFKKYNDQLGHLAGDACLEAIAKVLGDQGRPADLAARTGGEEFCVILPYTSIEGAIGVAEKIRARIESLAIDHPSSSVGHVTVSIGVAASGCDNVSDEHALFEVADAALYRAKRSGRNRVSRYSSEGIQGSAASLSGGGGEEAA